MNTKETSFIEANTEPATYDEVKQHFIPRFAKDNEPLISQVSFMDIVKNKATTILKHEPIGLEMRKSHLINGCIPEAMHKSSKELLDSEKVIRYERIGFVYKMPVELPLQLKSTQENMILDLTVGGIKAYNLDNLNSDSKSLQNFRVFIGLQNKVCLNMCIFGQGYKGTISVNTEGQLESQIDQLFSQYNLLEDIDKIIRLNEITINGLQVRNFIDNARLVNAMPEKLRKEKGLTAFPLGDSQMGTFCKDYYTNPHFGVNGKGTITGWQFYNLLTNANKSSYLDEMIPRIAAVSSMADSILNNNTILFN